MDYLWICLTNGLKFLKVPIKDLSAIMADGTGIKQYKGHKGELRAVIGITKRCRVEPLGSFTNTEWPDIERNIKERIKEAEPYNIPLSMTGNRDFMVFSLRLPNPNATHGTAPQGFIMPFGKTD